jgi:hypothetical protein
MNEWVAPAAGVLGTLAGGTAVAFFTRRLEEARWRREDRVRWQTARHEAYATFLNATRRVYEHGRVVMLMTDPDDLSVEKSPERKKMLEERWHQMFAAQEDMKVALAEIEILASEAVRKAAHRLERAVDGAVRGTLDFKLALREDRDAAKEQVGKVIRQELDAREDFRRAARVEFGVVESVESVQVSARPIGMASPYVPRGRPGR